MEKPKKEYYIIKMERTINEIKQTILLEEYKTILAAEKEAKKHLKDYEDITILCIKNNSLDSEIILKSPNDEWWMNKLGERGGTLK